VSVSTTKLGLAVVRAAQGRDEEAEALLHEAIEGFALYDMRALEHWALRYLAEFLAHGAETTMPSSTKSAAPGSPRRAPRRSSESTPRPATR